MKLRIIYLHRLEFSGSSQTIQVLRDYHALLPYVHDVHLFYRAAEPLPAAQLNAHLTGHGLAPSPDFHFHCIEEGARGKRRLARAAAALLPAGVHSSVLVVRTMDHARMALALRARAERVRVLIELHEGAFPHLVYREHGRALRAWWSRRTERQVLRDVDGIIATVGSQLTLLDELFPEHARAAVLPNGVDIDAFGARPARSPGGRFRLRYAGQFLAWKNTDVMIEALRYLPEETVLELAGGKPGLEHEARAAIGAVAARAGVERRVHYQGYLAPKDVPAFLMQADALLLPLGNNVQSRYLTSPMKLFEYAASGVPMIAARQPTILSLIQEGEQALLYAADSAQELAEAVKLLMRSPSRAAQLAEQARRWVAQYSYAERARRYRDFLAAVTG